MITVTDLSLNYSGTPLFSHVDLQFLRRRSAMTNAARPPGRTVRCAAALPARGGGVPAFCARPSAGDVPDFSRRPIHFRRPLCKRDRGIIFFYLRGKFHIPKGYPHFPPSFPQCVMLSATRPHFA